MTSDCDDQKRKLASTSVIKNNSLLTTVMDYF